MSVSIPTSVANATTENTSLLRRTLQFDLGFALVSSLAFIIFSGQLATLSGFASNALLAIGVVCLGYAGFIWWAIGNMPLRQVGWICVVLNSIWVVASILLLASGWLPLTTFGFWMVVLLAVDVDLIASVQVYALLKRR